MKLLPLIAPLLVFGLVVFVHELGHFLAAKAVGIYAPVFALGWGRRVFGVRRGETDYRLALFPIGGYVRMASREDEAMAAFEGGSTRGGLDTSADGPPKGEPGIPWDETAMVPFGPKPVPSDRWFESKPLWAKLVVMLAGVTMNFLLAILVVAGIRLANGTANPRPVIGTVLPASPAAAAGLMVGDSITAIDGAKITKWAELVAVVTAKPSTPLSFELVREGATRSMTIAPAATIDTNPQTGVVRSIGRIGAASSRVSVGPIDAIGGGLDYTWTTIVSTVDVLGGLLSGNVSPKQLGGPIMIAQASFETAKVGGFSAVLMLMALISVNIAVLNLLPVPVLDGGQVLLAILESARGKPLGERAKGVIMYAGVGLVLLLLITTTFNDLTRVGAQVLDHLRG
jgi:regulator of sigma E protease